jgi:Holliday junction resolvase
VSGASEYLERTRVRELASQLEAEGYEVTVEPGGPDAGFDIIATKDGRTVAAEVKVRDDLRYAYEEIRRLRQEAERRGYEFRLIVVTPPHRVDIDIHDFEQKLLAYIRKERPSGLEGVSPSAVLDNVTDVEFDRVEITKEGINVRGSGIVEVELSAQDDTGQTVSDVYDFTFDSAVTSDLEIIRSDVVVNASGSED